MSKTIDISLKGLPGESWIVPAIAGLQAGEMTAEGLCLLAARGRFEFLGIELPQAPGNVEPERAFYDALLEQEGDAYYRYNAFRREMDSFIEALEGRRRRALAGGSVALALS